MKVAPVLEARVIVSPVLTATNTIVSSTGATSTVALVLTPVLLTTNTNVASTSATRTPILLADFNGIYAVLSRIKKCHKSRVFGANFLGQKIGWC